MKLSSNPEALVSGDVLHADLTAMLAHLGTGHAELRPAIVKILKASLEASHRMAETKLLADGDGTRCAEFLSFVEDQVIRSLFEIASKQLFPAREGED